MQPFGGGRDLIQQARQHLAQLDTTSVLKAGLHYLQRRPYDGFDWYSRHPWITLIVMKWAAELWREGEHRQDATDDDMDFVHQRVFSATASLLRSHGRHSVFLRRMAFQQVWYQRSFNGAALFRQALLFGELMRESEPVRRFSEESGVSPPDFIRQLAHMIADVGDRMGEAPLSAMRPTRRSDDATLRPRVMRFFMTTIAGLHRDTMELARYETPPEVELCEQSPLIRTPFIETDRGYELIHHKLLFRSVETALYDLLRNNGAEDFMRAFGPAFEVYVGLVLGEMGHRVIPEQKLRGLLRGKGKCVDYAVVFDDALVLVDAKGIEGHYDELYHNLPPVLTDKLKTTALHAADQAVDTVRRLPDDLRRPVTYFLCVTYKQFNIGTGDALRDLTIETPEWDNDRWRESMLPPSHMFTVSASEIELLAGFVRSTGFSMQNLLNDIVAENAVPETSSKLLVEMHLGKYVDQVDWPNCVRDAGRHLCGMM